MGKHHRIWFWSQWYDPWWYFFGNLWGTLWREGLKGWDREKNCPLVIVWCDSPEVWMAGWANTQQASEGGTWLGLSLLELQFLLRGMFWTHLKSKWPLFFAFCSTISSGTIEAPCCRTRVGYLIALLEGYNIYIVVVFGEGIFYEMNFLGVSYTWPLTTLCLNRSQGVGGMLASSQIRILDISRCSLGAEWAYSGEIDREEGDWILHVTCWNEKFQFYHALWLNWNLWEGWKDH